MSTCSETGCGRIHYARGLCIKHYSRWHREKSASQPRPLCSEGGCPNPVVARGFCDRHYRRHKKYGSPTGGVRAPYGSGLGHLKKATGYRIVDGRGQHRIVMEKMIGRKLESSETVHHRNGDRADNRPENLALYSGRHPRGQSIEDMVTFCEEYLRKYKPIQRRLRTYEPPSLPIDLYSSTGAG